jgi:hypothetical protein
MDTASNATRTAPSATYKWGVLVMLGTNGTYVPVGWFKTEKEQKGFALTQVQLRGTPKGCLVLARWYGA